MIEASSVGLLLVAVLVLVPALVPLALGPVPVIGGSRLAGLAAATTREAPERDAGEDATDGDGEQGPGGTPPAWCSATTIAAGAAWPWARVEEPASGATMLVVAWMVDVDKTAPGDAGPDVTLAVTVYVPGASVSGHADAYAMVSPGRIVSSVRLRVRA